MVIGQFHLVRGPVSGKRTIALDLGQRLQLIASQRGVLVPAVLGDVVVPLGRGVLGRVLPTQVEFLAGLDLVLVPPVGGLLVQVLGEIRSPGGQVSVLRATRRGIQAEPLRCLNGLRLVLDRAQIGVRTHGRTSGHIRFGIADVPVGIGCRGTAENEHARQGSSGAESE